MNTTTLTLPAHWASYLINGDGSSLYLNQDQGEEEIDLIERLLEYEGAGNCISCTEKSQFRWVHDATGFGALSGDCLTYTFELPDFPEGKLC